MLTCWLIRHGESESNAGLPTGDMSLIRLTAKGLEQARKVAQAFTLQPDLIVTSRYVRASQTAQPTISRFPRVPVEEWPVHEFTYLSLPQDLLMTVGQRAPLAEEYWTRCDPFYIDGPGAESFSDFIGRADSFLHRLRDFSDADYSDEGYRDATIAVFSHGQFIQAVLWLLLRGPIDIDPNAIARYRQFTRGVPFANGAIVRIHFARDGNGGVNRMVSGIVTSHLYPDPVAPDPVAHDSCENSLIVPDGR
jgi:broad specificity phosphatase PhoE